MFAIHRRPSWAISEALATPEQVFADRRHILKGMGLGLAGISGLLPRPAAAQETDPTADLYPAAKNETYTIERALTPRQASMA